MPVTQIGIVYSISQRCVRRIIIPSSDDREIDIAAAMRSGEALLKLPVDHSKAISAVNAAIANHTGKSTISDRCCIIDGNNKVLHVIKADPSIDNHPSGVLVQNDQAGVGWSYANRIFIAPVSDEVSIL